ncbi:MAG: MotA/TolQ/ExbB proton channel family protein [Deltaproteobacteria bacterium]|jgi:chemotaxis protein MotA|nr:MotA/TolQ/ExbB proton channel family protein [Deltaproteobacteria bacterium]
MDFGTIFGILSATGLIVYACMFGADLGTFIQTFVDLSSVCIVFLGSIATVFIMYPLHHLKGILKVLLKCFFYTPINSADIVTQIVRLSEKARRESILALEKARVPYPFMNRGIQLIADGTEQILLRNILDIDMSLMQQRHWRGQDVFKSLGTYAPAFGMIGTLIGLVQMLRQMDDPATIGPAMAVALLTTLYGSLMANVIFLPLAKKLEERSKEEYQSMELMREGILAIQKGEHPAVIKEKLYSFLPKASRGSPGIS